MIVACGTAYHAGLLGKARHREARQDTRRGRDRQRVPLREPHRGRADARRRHKPERGDDRYSRGRSGGAGVSADECSRLPTRRGSLITREADAVLLTKAGPEICVASTKTFVAQVAALDLLALGARRHSRGSSPRRELPGDRYAASGWRRRRSRRRSGCSGAGWRRPSDVFEEARCSLFLGRGISYPGGARRGFEAQGDLLPPSEGYPAGEMKHGPIALVDEHCPVVAVLGEGLIREKTLSNVEETVARGANVIAVAREGDRGARTDGSPGAPGPRGAGDPGPLGL